MRLASSRPGRMARLLLPPHGRPPRPALQPHREPSATHQAHPAQLPLRRLRARHRNLGQRQHPDHNLPAQPRRSRSLDHPRSHRDPRWMHRRSTPPTLAPPCPATSDSGASPSAEPTSSPRRRATSRRSDPPVAKIEQHRMLRSRKTQNTLRNRRPARAPLVRPLGHQNHPAAVMVQNLHSTRPTRAKHRNNPRSRLQAQMVPRVDAQRCYPSTEINRLQRKVDSRSLNKTWHHSLPDTLASGKHGNSGKPAVEGGQKSCLR